MADTKALFTQRFDAARTALTAGDEPAAAEALHAAVVVARSDPSLRRELASGLFHLGKLSRKFGRAGEVEAQSLLTEALAISEELFGKEHAALAPLLNELSRLYVQRSQYARAEDALERLLAIARGKGEENADVATALAGLAVVKRKLGDVAAAEALYRDALRIREKVLEPDHMVTVVTLEQLSETCAVRGNLAEAVALLRRALGTREVVLGPGHATAQAARSRVGELELQLAVAADTAAAAAAKAARGAMATPAWFNRVPDSPPNTSSAVPSPVNSKKLEILGEPEPRPLRPAPLSRERAKTPAVTAAVAAASLMASSIQTPAVSQVVIPAPESVISRESGALHRDLVLADVAYSEVASDDAAVGDSQSTPAPEQADAPAPARKKRTVLYASAGLAAVTIAGLLMLMMKPGAGGGGNPVAPEKLVSQQTPVSAPVAPAPVTGSVATAAAAVAGAAKADSLASASGKAAPTAAGAQPEQRPAELRLPRVEVKLNTIDIPQSVSIPTITVAPTVDSSVRLERPRASDTDRTTAAERAAASASVDADNAVTPVRAIGRPPEPRFPDALLRAGRREGQVIVRFMVTERGNVDVASMIVERSDDEQFTDAVRDILPQFRFEPARTRESKPVATWVSVPFRFTTKKK